MTEFQSGLRVGIAGTCFALAIALGALVLYWVRTDPVYTADTACPVPKKNAYNFPPEVRP